MKIVVQKYGGTSLSTIEKIKKVAQNIVNKRKEGYEVVVVVSAMGKTTDKLLEMAHQISSSPDKRELDMLLTTGERQTISLLAISLRNLGYNAISLTGSQSGIITNTVHNNAKILEVRPYRIEDAIDESKIAIVAGFQGVSYLKEVTTLGRGGSDTTALALTAALGAESCEIFSDVDGIYSADPRVVDLPKKIDQISYEQMLEMAQSGAKVLATEAIRFAKHYKIKLYSKHAFKSKEGTFVTDKKILKDVIAVTSEDNLIFVKKSKDSLDRMLIWLLDNEISYKELWSDKDDITFVFDKENIHDDNSFLDWLDRCQVEVIEDYGKVSLIGNRLNSNTDILLELVNILDSKRIEYSHLNLDHIKISMVVKKSIIKTLVNILHKEFIK